MKKLAPDVDVINRYNGLTAAIDTIDTTPIFKVAERDYGIKRAEAPQVMDALLQWMAAASADREDERYPQAMLDGDIDNMWHSFILNTKEYRNVCDEVFGEYFDHEPETAEDEDEDDFQSKIQVKHMLQHLVDSYGVSLNPLLKQWVVSYQRWATTYMADLEDD
ncbi:MAG: hypothetical protein OXI96_08515 [Acidimicrobiaceae bacterium]|nr:hypothetical protein [Acidimicrobiaceae bacterium]